MLASLALAPGYLMAAPSALLLATLFRAFGAQRNVLQQRAVSTNQCLRLSARLFFKRTLIRNAPSALTPRPSVFLTLARNALGN